MAASPRVPAPAPCSAGFKSEKPEQRGRFRLRRAIYRKHRPVARAITSRLEADSLADWRNIELFADFARQAVVDFHMPGHRSLLAVCGIQVDRMAAAFALQFTAASLEITQQVTALHRCAWVGRVVPAATER